MSWAATQALLQRMLAYSSARVEFRADVGVGRPRHRPRVITSG
ncbi:MAG: hypothetical protein AVDCRST_MAG67-3110 [uncultured Solirubrobacteraceae bacterium]|uniref:Uncharacterized protein n=1 Tax=uncultured Solirubrobacteraceae bacterium TaxID=1162706 RepID=A0A6J4T9V8_9ACTN|nr:MAG: hypothetical protein AVDCRST_MAG67-3110 [uncultured Solirubrobacteraceae bacterium]